MFQNVAELATMKFCIGGNRSQSRMPDAEHQLHVIGTILRDDGDTFTGLKIETVTQRARKPCGPPGDLAVTLDDARPQSYGRPFALARSCTFKPKRKIHCSTKYPRFMTRREDGVSPPFGNAALICGLANLLKQTDRDPWHSRNDDRSD